MPKAIKDEDKVRINLRGGTSLIRVDRIGKNGSRTYEFDSVLPALEMAKALKKDPDVLFVNVWS